MITLKRFSPWIWHLFGISVFALILLVPKNFTRKYYHDVVSKPKYESYFSLPDTAKPDFLFLNPTFLGGEGRNYYNQFHGRGLKVIWKHYLGSGKTLITAAKGVEIKVGAGWTGQPLLCEEKGKLFIIQGAYDHNLKKINGETGELVWEYGFDDMIKGTGTIVENKNSTCLEDKYLVMQGSRYGFGYSNATSPVIPSFRCVSYMTGKEYWRMNSVRTSCYSRDCDGSAVFVNDTAYIGLENGWFTAFNPDPAKTAEKEGVIQPEIYQQLPLWQESDKKLHGGNLVTESSPCRMGDHIYVTSGSGHVYGYNLKTRKLDWDFFTGSDIDGSPVVTDDSCLIVTIEKQYIEGNGGTLKLNPRVSPDSAVVWFFPTINDKFCEWLGGIIGSATVNDKYKTDSMPNLAVFTGIDGYMYVVNHKKLAPGKKVKGFDGKKEYPTPVLVYKNKIGPSISTPIIYKDRIIAAGYQGVHLFEYDSKLNFKLLEDFEGNFEATPIGYGDKLFISSRNGYLYCFGEKQIDKTIVPDRSKKKKEEAKKKKQDAAKADSAKTSKDTLKQKTDTIK